MPWEFTDGQCVISEKVNWSIWYKQPDCLETNCVSVETKRLYDTDKAIHQCPTYMSK